MEREREERNSRRVEGSRYISGERRGRGPTPEMKNEKDTALQRVEAGADELAVSCSPEQTGEKKRGLKHYSMVT